MEKDIFSQILLPLALFIIMMGMGLTLVSADFKRIIRYPQAVVIGLILKLLIIPMLTFLILYLFPIQPELAVGFILLAACPGGATTNLITNLAKGDVALSITLTAIASIITVITIPIVVNIGLNVFMGESKEISLPFFKTVGQILAITVVPVIIGMYVKHKYPEMALKTERMVKIISAIFLVLIIVAVMIKERDNLVEYFIKVGPMAFALNLLGMLIGYFVLLIFTKQKKQAVTVGIEVGVVNGTLGIAIAAGILQNSAMTIPSAIYSILMFPGALLMIYLGTKKAKMDVK